MGNLLSCLAVTRGLPCLLGSVGLLATGRLLALAEPAAAEVLASPFRLATTFNVGLRLTVAREVNAGADVGLTQGLSLRLVLKLMQLLQEQWRWQMYCESLQQL